MGRENAGGAMAGDERPVRITDLKARLKTPTNVIRFAAYLAGVELATVGGTAFLTPAQVAKVVEFFDEKDPQYRFHARKALPENHATRGRTRR